MAALLSALMIVRLYCLAEYDDKTAAVLSGQYSRCADVMSRSGFVFDRNGFLISHTQSGMAAIVDPTAVGDKDRDKIAEALSENGQASFSEIISKLEERAPFTVSLEKAPDGLSDAEGIYLFPLYEQEHGSFLRHVFGYRDGDGNGRSGIYEKYGGVLSDLGGSVYYTYTSDAAGNIRGPDGFTVSNDGYAEEGEYDSGLLLTIDKAIQETVDEVCEEKLDMGAVVICDVNTGELLAVSSRPLYDDENIALSLESDRGELINRAFSRYTPGSVFKSVVAAAALEYDMELYGFEYECTGSLDVSGQIFRCHDHSGHGVQSMCEAYANSCNTYFISLAFEIGLDTIYQTARKMGLGDAYAIDGLFVSGAVLPENKPVYPPAYLANISFGQGDLMVSPIDILNVTCICSANRKHSFSLVKGIRMGEVYEEYEKKEPQKVLSDETAAKMCEMMRECAESGTGRSACAESVDVGVKTATAQSGQFRDGQELLHRWVAGVFPIDEPKYALVVLCDGNGEGSASPGEIFGEIAERVWKIDSGKGRK